MFFLLLRGGATQGFRLVPRGRGLNLKVKCFHTGETDKLRKSTCRNSDGRPTKKGLWSSLFLLLPLLPLLPTDLVRQSSHYFTLDQLQSTSLTFCWSQVFLRGSCWQDCVLPFLCRMLKTCGRLQLLPPSCLGNSYHPSHLLRSPW